MDLNRPITKRQVGALLIAVGILIVAGVFAYDILKHHPIGDRFQLAALALGALLAFMGTTLLPFGATPA